MTAQKNNPRRSSTPPPPPPPPPPPTPLDQAGAFGRSSLHSLTMGADDLVGAGFEIGPWDAHLVDRYKAAVRRAHQKHEDDQRRYPAASMAGEVAGTAASFLVPGAAELAGAKAAKVAMTLTKEARLAQKLERAAELEQSTLRAEAGAGKVVTKQGRGAAARTERTGPSVTGGGGKSGTRGARSGGRSSGGRKGGSTTASDGTKRLGPLKVTTQGKVAFTALNTGTGAAANVAGQALDDAATGHRSSAQDLAASAVIGALTANIPNPELSAAANGGLQSAYTDLKSEDRVSLPDVAMDASQSALLSAGVARAVRSIGTIAFRNLVPRLLKLAKPMPGKLFRPGEATTDEEAKGSLGELLAILKSHVEGVPPIARTTKKGSQTYEGYVKTSLNYAKPDVMRVDGQMVDGKYGAGASTTKNQRALKKDQPDRFHYDHFLPPDLADPIGRIVGIFNPVRRRSDSEEPKPAT